MQLTETKMFLAIVGQHHPAIFSKISHHNNILQKRFLLFTQMNFNEKKSCS